MCLFNLLRDHNAYYFHSSVLGIFRGNQKPSKKDKQNGKTDGSDGNKESGTEVARVDEEGYVIREPSTYESLNKKEEKFYTDSDSDSDGEENKKPIKVVIKPINGPSSNNRYGSIAELQQTVRGLTISPSITSAVRSHFLSLSTFILSLLITFFQLTSCLYFQLTFFILSFHPLFNHSV